MKEHQHRRPHRKFTHEIKLFTDKNEMIAFVNQLTSVENVEIFKIEEHLYKVHVTRRLMDQDTHECCHGHDSEQHECCQGDHHHDHQPHHDGCCKDQK